MSNRIECSEVGNTGDANKNLYANPVMTFTNQEMMLKRHLKTKYEGKN